jgi:two-component system sensor histidine kinase GlrK
MKLSIFTRLTIGFLTVFVVVGSMNVYALLKLDELNAGTSRIINIDQRLLELRKGLGDSILAQMGFEKKYAITRDPTFYERLVAAEQDFDRTLAEASGVAATPPEKEPLARAKALYEKYRSLIEEETDGASKDSRLRDRHAENEKEKLVDGILRELNALESSIYRDISVRMGGLNQAGRSVRKLTVIIWAFSLILIVATAFITTRSVTKPVSVLVRKTEEVSKGVFRGDLSISSPPEVAQLAGAFNAMCEKLGRVEKMKSNFFSGMSHELRTPLTSIKEGIGLLQDGVGGSVTEKQKRLLTILSEETRRLIDLVNSLLDLSKMQEGMMPYYFNEESLPLLVERVVAEIGPLIEAKKIQLFTDTDRGVPALKVDRERILQALRNLLGNAVKFTPEGGLIRIAVQRRNDGVAFSVKDTGPGIPRESRDAIFEEFHQLAADNADWVKGTGLGLAIVKEIVTAHRGRVWVESEPGSGSTFIFVLPF